MKQINRQNNFLKNLLGKEVVVSTLEEHYNYSGELLWFDNYTICLEWKKGIEVMIYKNNIISIQKTI